MRSFLTLVLALSIFSCNQPIPAGSDEPRNPQIDSAEKYKQLFHKEKKADLDLASSYADKVLSYSLAAGYDQGIADGHAYTAYIKYYSADYPGALETYVLALGEYESMRDTSGIANSCYTIGKIHRMMHNFPEALQYAKRGLALHTLQNSWSEISSDLNGIGNIYAEMGKYDSAFSYFTQRVQLEEKYGDSASVASALADLAASYTANGDAETGLKFHLAALHKLNAVLQDTSSWYLQKFKAGVLNDMAMDYFQLHDYGSAIQTAERGLAIADSVHARKEKRIAYKTLAEMHGLSGHEDIQMQYLEKYIALNDSLLNEDGQKRIANAEVRYHLAEKEAVIAKLDASNTMMQLDAQRAAKETQLIWIGIGVFILLGGTFGYVLYARSQLRHKQDEFRSMIEGEENERKRIAMELHDGLGQLLSSARLNVSGLEESVKKEDEFILHNSLSLIDDACTEVRNVSHNLMPAALIKMGLVPALRELSSQISASGKIVVTFSADLFTAKLNNTEEIALYRIIQETVNNALKYSRAEKIAISLSGSSVTTATVSDNGIGLPEGASNSNSGIGWRNIRSRVELMNGSFDIKSSRGNGTTITINLQPSGK
jgi:two-component system NarL family sensor kinase